MVPRPARMAAGMADRLVVPFAKGHQGTSPCLCKWSTTTAGTLIPTTTAFSSWTKSDILCQAVEAQECLLVFLPPYSPDFNPIEQSFSSCTFGCVTVAVYSNSFFLVKAWMRHHWREMRDTDNPQVALYEATSIVMGQKAKGWIQASGYNL